ncbi:MAG: hypothetical protein C4548_13465, partial [Desulfobacteraceae bacterium]
MVDPSGHIATIAGIGGSWGYSGDGHPATQANLGGPSGLALDQQGNVYIADTNNARVRQVAQPKPNLVINEGQYLADENGWGYRPMAWSYSSPVTEIIDLATGQNLYHFDYTHDDKLLASITDQFGNETRVNWSGYYPYRFAQSIVAPHGQTTQLIVDPISNRLTRITYPDGSRYDFEYTSDGL